MILPYTIQVCGDIFEEVPQSWLSPEGAGSVNRQYVVIEREDIGSIETFYGTEFQTMVTYFQLRNPSPHEPMLGFFLIFLLKSKSVRPLQGMISILPFFHIVYP